MPTVGELNVIFTADSSDYIRQLNNVQSQTDRVMNNVSSVMSKVKRTVAAALGTVAIVNFGKSCLQLGSDLAEVQNVVDTVFTTMSDSVNKFAKNAAESYGLSETMAKKYMGTFGAMATGFGFAEQEAYNMSAALTGLSGDVASFYNMTQDEAFNKLRSVFSGEVEPLRELGIVMTENSLKAYAQAQGINANISAMSEQEKVALRYNFVLNQLSLAQGDFAKTSDSWQNQVRIMQLRFESFKATMGQGLINVFLPVIKVINAVIQKLQVFASYFSAITGAIFGKAQKGTTQTSNAIGTTPKGLSTSLGNAGKSANNASKGLKKASKATKATGTAAKKAKKEIKGLISGLDEINNLSSNTTPGTKGTKGSTPKVSTPSTGGIGGVGGIGDLGGIGDIPTIDLGSKIDTTGLEAKVEKVKKTIEKFKKFIQKHKDVIISVLAGLGAGMGFLLLKNWKSVTKTLSTSFPLLSKVFSKVGKAILKPLTLIKTAIKGLLSINPVTAMMTAAITAIVSSLVYLWRTNEKFRDNVIRTWKNIKKALEPWLKAFGELLKLIADIIMTVVIVAFKLLSKAVVKVVEVFSGDLMGDINKLCPGVKSLGQAFLGLVKALSKTWKNVKKFLAQVQAMVKKVGLKKTIEILMKKLINKIVEKVGEIKKKFNDKFKEVTENIKKYISEKWEELTSSIKEFAINIASKVEDFKEKVIELWDNTKAAAKDFVLNIASKVEDFKEKVTEKWNDVKESAKDFVLNIVSKVEDFKEKVIEKWNSVKEAAKDFILNITSKVADFKEKVSEKWNEAKTWLKDKVLEIGSKVSDFYKTVQDKLNEAKTWLKDKALEISSKVSSFYKEVKKSYNNAKEKIKSWVFDVGVKVSSFYDKVKSAYNSAKSKIKSWVFSVGVKVGSFYDKLRSAYNSAKSKIKRWAFSISLKVNTSANNVKNTINGIIRQINSAVFAKIKITVPNWVPVFGGKTWGPPKGIPYLAKGGIVDSATLAMIGEAGKEAVVPLENNTGGLDLLARKLQSRMSISNISAGFNSNNQGQNKGDTYTGDVVIKLDGNTVLRQSVVSILRQMKRQGVTI